jgi:hypothetical protein
MNDQESPEPKPEQKAPMLAGDEMVISEANPLPEAPKDPAKDEQRGT